METKIPPGWRQVPDHAAADPDQKPADAVALLARGPRMAWLLSDGSLSDGRGKSAPGADFKVGPFCALALAAVLLAGCASTPTTSYIAECERHFFREGITHPEGVPARLYCTDIAQRRAATRLPQ